MKKIIVYLFIALIAIVSYWFVVSNNKPVDAPVSLDFGDGKYLGYIHNVDTEKKTLAFDDAVWLTGKVAQDAAIEAGHCTEESKSDCLPNDYFIKNSNVKDDLLLIDDNVQVIMQTWSAEETGRVENREIALADLAKVINDQSLHWRALPYNITIQNGKIICIEEQYVP